MIRLLFVEDDVSLMKGLVFALEKQGYEVVCARSLREAEEKWHSWSNGQLTRPGTAESSGNFSGQRRSPGTAESSGNFSGQRRSPGTAESSGQPEKYDLVILDVSLPDGTGYALCEKIRETSKVPIIFLTAADDETDITMGLDMGGDDYITKPFKLAVFLSRVNALLRRSTAYNEQQVLCAGDITVDLLRRTVTKNGETLPLTASEYKLLVLFMENAGLVLTPEQILSRLWDHEAHYIDNSTLTVYIRRLRMKIEDDPSAPQHILTVRGMGYKWTGGEGA